MFWKNTISKRLNNILRLFFLTFIVLSDEPLERHDME